MADSVAVSPAGVVVFIEYKNAVGIQSDDQKNFERQIKRRSGNYWLIRSLEELKKMVEAMT